MVFSGLLPQVAQDVLLFFAGHVGNSDSKCFQNRFVGGLPFNGRHRGTDNDLAAHHIQQILFSLNNFAHVGHGLCHVILDPGHIARQNREQLQKQRIELERVFGLAEQNKLSLGRIDHLYRHLVRGYGIVGSDNLPGTIQKELKQFVDSVVFNGFKLRRRRGSRGLDQLRHILISLSYFFIVFLVPCRRRVRRADAGLTDTTIPDIQSVPYDFHIVKFIVIQCCYHDEMCKHNNPPQNKGARFFRPPLVQLLSFNSVSCRLYLATTSQADLSADSSPVRTISSNSA